jgi:general secretion pathway protein L
LRSLSLPNLGLGSKAETLTEPVRAWWHSLRGCLPPTLRRLLSEDVCRIRIEPWAGGYRLFQETDAEAVPLGEFPAEALGDARSLVAGIKADRRVITMTLPGDLVLERDLSLPSGVEENLRQVLGFELDRLTPFGADQAYYDYRVLGRRAANQKLDVRIVVAPRARVEPWLNTLAAAGLEPAVVDPAGVWPRANLLPPEVRRHHGWWTSKLNWLLMLVPLALLVGLLAVPISYKRGLVQQLGQELAQVRSSANQTLSLREKLEKNTQSALFVVNKRSSTPPVVDVLLELTALIPDDTWVQQLELRQGQLQIRGESALATVLLERLEDSAMFSGVGFRSPLVQVPAKTMERFHIAAEVAPRAKP